MIPVAISQFADSTSSSNGIGAFNINLKAFIFQLITFLVVLMVFKKWILPPIMKTLEDRRKTLEESLAQAKKTEEILKQAEVKAQEILTKTRKQADEVLAEAKISANQAIAKGETAAAGRAELIIKEAEAHLSEERDKLRQELRGELTDLVADATEKIIAEKMDERSDRSLIERAIKELAR